ISDSRFLSAIFWELSAIPGFYQRFSGSYQRFQVFIGDFLGVISDSRFLSAIFWELSAIPFNLSAIRATFYHINSEKRVLKIQDTLF
ncbi:hypothetical protein ACQKNC_14640, partial [Lysinibacillus sp. NPDC094177]|uniref:hypothetical protein n=1 Tax=Lysinibacillus sp. NPDC094177 TaxID=3390580 RepID=UPI003D02A0DB